MEINKLREKTAHLLECKEANYEHKQDEVIVELGKTRGIKLDELYTYNKADKQLKQSQAIEKLEGAEPVFRGIHITTSDWERFIPEYMCDIVVFNYLRAITPTAPVTIYIDSPLTGDAFSSFSGTYEGYFPIAGNCNKMFNRASIKQDIVLDLSDVTGTESMFNNAIIDNLTLTSNKPFSPDINIFNHFLTGTLDLSEMPAMHQDENKWNSDFLTADKIIFPKLTGKWMNLLNSSQIKEAVFTDWDGDFYNGMCQNSTSLEKCNFPEYFDCVKYNMTNMFRSARMPWANLGFRLDKLGGGSFINLSNILYDATVGDVKLDVNHSDRLQGFNMNTCTCNRFTIENFENLTDYPIGVFCTAKLAKEFVCDNNRHQGPSLQHKDLFDGITGTSTLKKVYTNILSFGGIPTSQTVINTKLLNTAQFPDLEEIIPLDGEDSIASFGNINLNENSKLNEETIHRLVRGVIKNDSVFAFNVHFSTKQLSWLSREEKEHLIAYGYNYN